VESGERVIVGVNRFQSAESGEEIPVFRVNAENERAQVESVRQLRASRDDAAWKRSIADLESGARGSENLMPRIVAAAEASATVGELSDALRRVFGEYRER
jgi:methylmalonyl-CoA mutase N-terminal domain/subunit